MYLKYSTRMKNRQLSTTEIYKYIRQVVIDVRELFILIVTLTTLQSIKRKFI